MPVKASARYVYQNEEIFPIANFKKALEENFATRNEIAVTSLQILSIVNWSATTDVLFFAYLEVDF